MTSAVAPAMILAAGRGERMRPLTDTTPKPLLQVRGKPLMQWPMEALARGGFTDVVVNTAWLGEQISGTFGNQFGPWPSSSERDQLLNSEQPNVTAITYSHEGLDFGGALETAGGIVRALPALGDVFWVLAGDVFTPDFRFEDQAAQRFASGADWAHLWMVNNPEHNLGGDFALSPEGRVLDKRTAPPGTPCWTYSTIGLYRAAMVSQIGVGQKAALRPCLDRAIAQGRLSAEVYAGDWVDVGTPQRLADIDHGD
jgi:MurNAc alpha-1-phosphate uridylyltransferase